MNNKYYVIITTCETEKDAKEIIDSLLNKKLIACAQIAPINSFYFWKGSVANDLEVIILLKCQAELYKEIEQEILAIHKYETPEIIALPIICGSDSYLNWIDEVSK